MLMCSLFTHQVRTSAVTYLQRALLVPDLQVLSPLEWEGCFHRVLFPLLGELLSGSGTNGVGPVAGLEETRMRAATLLSKVFLQHLTPLLALSTFAALWFAILGYMEKFLQCDSRNDLLVNKLFVFLLPHLLCLTGLLLDRFSHANETLL